MHKCSLFVCAHKKRQELLGETADKITPDVPAPPPSSDTN